MVIWSAVWSIKQAENFLHCFSIAAKKAEVVSPTSKAAKN
jgi:hypothetical protein